MLVIFVLFYFILFCFVLFCFVLFLFSFGVFFQYVWVYFENNVGIVHMFFQNSMSFLFLSLRCLLSLLLFLFCFVVLFFLFSYFLGQLLIFCITSYDNHANGFKFQFVGCYENHSYSGNRIKLNFVFNFILIVF